MSRTQLVDVDTGRWLVTTANSQHLFDLDNRTTTRITGANPLRLDAAPVPLFGIIACRVGEPGEWWLGIRGDGVLTYRQTTTVTTIAEQQGGCVAPEACLYCDGTDPNCGFCDMGKPLDTQEDWDRTWGRILQADLS